MSTTQELSEKDVFWSNHVHDWQTSDLSAIAYCDHHSLNVKSLYRWVQTVKRRGLERRLVAAAKNAPLIPVTVLPDERDPSTVRSAPSPGCSAGIRILVHGKYVVELDIGFDAPTLERLLHSWSRP